MTCLSHQAPGTVGAAVTGSGFWEAGERPDTLRAAGPGLTVDPQGLAPLGEAPRHTGGTAQAATPQGGPRPEEDGAGGHAALKEGDTVW